MRNIRTKIASTAIAAALIFSPTAAVASTYGSQPSNSWVMLSALTPAGATALAGSDVAPSAATLAAAQSTVAYDDRRGEPVPAVVIGVWFAVLATMVYIAFIEDNDDDDPRQFVTSPA